MKIKTITRLQLAVVSLFIVMLVGTIFYRVIEGWNWVDAFYFTGITVTTVGYGDLVPTHDISKISTVFFAMAGAGIVLYSLWLIAEDRITDNQKTIHEFINRDNKKEEE